MKGQACKGCGKKLTGKERSSGECECGEPCFDFPPEAKHYFGDDEE